MFNVSAIVVFHNHTMEHPVLYDYLFGPDDVSRRPLNLLIHVRDVPLEVAIEEPGESNTFKSNK